MIMGKASAKFEVIHEIMPENSATDRTSRESWKPITTGAMPKAYAASICVCFTWIHLS